MRPCRQNHVGVMYRQRRLCIRAGKADSNRASTGRMGRVIPYLNHPSGYGYRACEVEHAFCHCTLDLVGGVGAA